MAPIERQRDKRVLGRTFAASSAMSASHQLSPAVAQIVGEMCVGSAVQRAARSLSRRYDAAFRPLGLSSWQFGLLMNLMRPEPSTINELAASLALDASTVTTNTKLLERRGLVAVQRDDNDRRARRVTLTDAGRALLTEALPRWEAVQKESIARFGEVELGMLRKALAALSD